jgi:hypothetical protein
VEHQPTGDVMEDVVLEDVILLISEDVDLEVVMEETSDLEAV